MFPYFTITVTGIDTDPPLSFPIIVNVVEVVEVNPAFGTNINEVPIVVCAVVDVTSPIYDGTVVDAGFDKPDPIIVPTFLFARIAVYPSAELYVGVVAGTIVIFPV